jgi:RNA polymerase sigma factor (sigma-70 family)
MAARDIGGVVNRESAAVFAQVYDEQIWHVYGFFGYRLGSRQDAEDLTQLTFERALRAFDRFDPNRASARTWLLSIAHNLLVDHYRSPSSSRVDSLPEGDAGEAMLGQAPPPDQRLGVSPELEAALGRLGDRERELIALRFGGDLTGPEIAAMTGLSLANVQQILSRTLRQLREDLEPPDDTQSAPGTRATAAG